MSYFDYWMLAVALAMDCMTVSMVCGMLQKKMEWTNLMLMAGLFGVFQAIMPVTGWYFSSLIPFSDFTVHRWLAFFILVFLGGKMIWESLKPKAQVHFNTHRIRTLLFLSVATSIDALTVDISFTCIGMRSIETIAYPIAVIGFVSFVMSIIGKWIGVTLGTHIHWHADRLGGIILILIGIKILLNS